MAIVEIAFVSYLRLLNLIHNSGIHLNGYVQCSFNANRFCRVFPLSTKMKSNYLEILSFLEFFNHLNYSLNGYTN